jgi:hypothetical protein
LSPRTASRATALLLTVVAGTRAVAAQPPAPVPSGGDLAFASYAFAPELGSGIYESNGRALQIYRLPFAFDQEGWRLTLPVTVGLLDFRSSDVIDLNLPRGVGSVSVVPGIERDFGITPNWSLTQFSKAGYTKTSGNADDAVLIGLGLRSNLRRPGVTLDEDGAVKPRAIEYLIYHELNLAIADLRGKLPGDHFLRLRTAVEGDLATPLTLGEHRLRVAPYVILDDYINPPTSPLTGRDADRYQKEIGFSLSLAPSPSRLGVPLPALGVSYRIAGELSGWRLAIGAPF